VVGVKLVLWLWGGFSVDTPTIGKFFTLHFLLPFVIAAIACLHIIFLHDSGSSSPLLTVSLRDQRYFLSYYAVKDLLGVIYLFTLLGLIVIYMPNLLGHPDNYIEANHMVTPLHIVPE
jgi:quinol-cytochrome oxidoreductase complex cytochrome b subunit